MRTTLAFLVSGLTLSNLACDRDREVAASIGIGSDAVAIPIGFDRAAWMLVRQDDEWGLDPVATERPVLGFFGPSIDGAALAYTSLARSAPDTPLGRRDVDAGEASALAIDELVPTGELIVERDGVVSRVSAADEFVVAAAWSPAIASLLAYTAIAGDERRIVLLDVAGADRRLELRGDYLVDHVWWSRDGDRILVPRVTVVAEGHEVSDAVIDVEVAAFGRQDGNEVPPRPDDAVSITSRAGAVALRLRSGRTLEVERLLGPTRVGVEAGDDTLVDRIAAWSDVGLAYVRHASDRIELGVIDDEGRDRGALASAAPVTYYLPFDATTRVTVTQVGASVSGGGCGLASHFAGGRMAYAIDLQISSGSDFVVAPAAGTVAGYRNSTTCNSLDTVGCAIYSSTCSSPGGFGNYVILAHADGTWTKFAHLQHGTVVPWRTGAVASGARGCRLGNEGGTGASRGNKNGCGDHLHFQRQTSSDVNGWSTPIAFADAAIGSSSCGASFWATAGGMSCGW